MIKSPLFAMIILLSVAACNDNHKEKTNHDTSSVSMKDKIKAANSLNSWNDGKNKKAIMDFVKSVTDIKSNSFVSVENRIAVFDNDGTLWVEQPIYSQFLFALDRIKALAPQHPEWKQKQPFKAILEGDTAALKAGGKKAILELMMATHADMTTDEFDRIVKEWIATAKHPKLNKPYTDCIYKPMLELILYLEAHEFKVYIVSGGGVEFMRPWSERVYGIPSEQIIGSSIKTKYEVRNGKPVLVRLPEIHFIDDKEGKPSGINEHIGKKPIIAIGNSDGDFEMLEWITTENTPALGVLIHHDDAEREFAYDRQSLAGKLDRGLDEAKERGWILISMKNDWKTIFK